MTAMVASAALLAGLGSVMMIARQIAYTPSASAKRLEASEAVSKLADDARCATFIATHTPYVFEFVVSDRDGDGAAERFRYEWSGVPGDPLKKTTNGGTAVVLVDSVQNFQYSLVTNSQTTAVTTTANSAEAVLASSTTIQSSTDWDITGSEFAAQQINPLAFASVPANAISWNATKVDFYGKQEGMGGGASTLLVQLRIAGDPNNSPTGSVLGQISIPEASLTSGQNWNSFVFPEPVRDLALHRGYSLAWAGIDGNKAARLRPSNVTASGVSGSVDAGATWQVMSAPQIVYRLYGTYTTPGPTYNVTRNYATRLNVVLQGGAASHSRINASVPLANRPELLSAYWRTDFDADPTVIDVTRDGVADWIVTDGDAFDTATLVDGVWQTNESLESRARNDFTKITTVDVRCRNTSVGGNGAVVQINADRQGGTHAPLFVRLQLQSDGTQTLTLFGKSNDTTNVSLFQRKFLSNGFVRFRMTVLPANNLVNLTINDEDQGTFSYPTFAPLADDRFLTFYESTSHAEFDHVELRIAE
jgi:hypothetical protein